VNWVKKNGSNLLFVVLQTSTPRKAFVSGLFAFSYSVQDVKGREVLQKYNWQWVDMNVSPRELASFSSGGLDSLSFRIRNTYRL
jgi:hypothetical protein